MASGRHSWPIDHPQSLLGRGSLFRRVAHPISRVDIRLPLAQNQLGLKRTEHFLKAARKRAAFFHFALQ